jgi:hypothetical protein
MNAQPLVGGVSALLRECAGAIGPFEVVDVHLTPGVMDGGGNDWLAYGALTTKERA